MLSARNRFPRPPLVYWWIIMSSVLIGLNKGKIYVIMFPLFSVPNVQDYNYTWNTYISMYPKEDSQSH